jgi:UDP-N-acetylglucosamine 2-epimerase (non-hydrolysing)
MREWSVKVLSTFGTRPEAIKMAPVLAELSRFPGAIESRVCVTAQHREMLDQVLDVFGIVPDVDLDVMTNDQAPWQVVACVLEGLSRVLADETPDLVLVHGDTTTTMAASLAAFYRKIPVGHVEAGLRTHDPYYPFPEEMNRVVADDLASLHFAPTARARESLLREGVRAGTVFVTGNTVIDALLEVAGRDGGGGALPVPVPPGARLVLVTAHRRENFGEPLRDICLALRDVADAHLDAVVVYPVHLNPNVQRTAHEVLEGHPRVTLTEPLSYEPFVRLMARAHVVVTDSGGIQEEAPSLGKPVLVLRNETERPEAVDAGTVRLVGTKRDVVAREVSRLLSNGAAYMEMAAAVNPYGDGRAATRTVAAIMREMGVPGGEEFEEFAPAAAGRGAAREKEH